MRGGAVGILIILCCDGEKHALLTVQPRLPIAMAAFPEIAVQKLCLHLRLWVVVLLL